MVRAGSYDHKRASMYAQEGRPLHATIVCPLWDFVFFTNNGNINGLRPKWGSLDFDVHTYRLNGVYQVQSMDAPQHLMLAPPGHTVGPGTYATYKMLEKKETWQALPYDTITRAYVHGRHH